MTTDLQTTSFELSKPEQSLQVAEILQKFVKEKKLTSNIKGKEDPQVEAWQFAGSQLGLYPELVSVQDLSNEKEIKYGAWVEIKRINDGKVMSKGYAICSNKESSKRQFDEYAICSMAQTRAEGKAFRMLLSWLMKAAGFEATPAEEMDFAAKKPDNDLLSTWQGAIDECKTKGDLLTLYNGNKATIDESPEIKAMLKKRDTELKSK